MTKKEVVEYFKKRNTETKTKPNAKQNKDAKSVLRAEVTVFKSTCNAHPHLRHLQ